MDRMRSCARPGCAEPAAATMTYAYATRTVVLHGAGGEHDATAAWGLCVAHAERLRVPVGWALEDARSPVVPLRRIAV